MVESSVTRVTARKTACARTGHELRLPGTTVSLLWVLMLYHRLASDGDMTEEAELRELEGGEVRGGASRRLGMHHLPTVTGVQVGCTTSQDAMRMGAVFVVPVHCGEVHRDSTRQDGYSCRSRRRRGARSSSEIIDEQPPAKDEANGSQADALAVRLLSPRDAAERRRGQVQQVQWHTAAPWRRGR